MRFGTAPGDADARGVGLDKIVLDIDVEGAELHELRGQPVPDAGRQPVRGG
ncbi:hypothetical protein ACQP1G_01575 [Nocardia sp. CA-107356]|uniref:hypothetical protein n=1 Tax=Nocardia sp. CA-107356 TaxID=3239972 RepID=UPI003D90EC1F